MQLFLMNPNECIKCELLHMSSGNLFGKRIFKTSTIEAIREIKMHNGKVKVMAQEQVWAFESS